MLGPGDAVLVGGGEAGLQQSPGDYCFIGLRVPQIMLRGAVGRLDDTFCRKIPAQTPALRLLNHYADVLETGSDLAGDLPVLASHMRDLVTLALGATRDDAAAATARGGRAAHLRAIKADIEANLQQPGLSTATVAARHRLTERSLQRLFETEGISCTAFILERRLARAHRMLTDSRYAERSITTIMFDAGFQHQSHFTSAFRARFGASASEVRASALEPAG